MVKPTKSKKQRITQVEPSKRLDEEIMVKKVVFERIRTEQKTIELDKFKFFIAFYIQFLFLTLLFMENDSYILASDPT